MIDEIKPKKKILKWVWIIGGIIILIVIISLAGGNEKKESSQPSKLEIFNQTEQEVGPRVETYLNASGLGLRAFGRLDPSLTG